MKFLTVVAVVGTLTWTGLWFTADQQGQRLMNRGQFEAAARTFRDPMRIGVAWYRAGEFEKAEQAFARVGSAESEFNRGNCLILRGKYDAAVERFDRALEHRPGWSDATINRDLAVARADRIRQEGGEMGDQKLGADEIVFDKNKSSEGENTESKAAQPLSDSAMQELWLRRVQTKPRDFLKAKFAYQLAQEER
ncbi:tetratricopeptide repeat protein [Stieleria sp. ICT_E10.1]|uniref:tetratricopeptide repeat protein n=1 Tax=Stieleria sedimenti TaxID=2976331 RepID=UPI002180637F|nr:tetratricopeptide repeat protein [Stieleria sedimenti]MCS7467362.1 tetratricopeptide repeat protein [Stieleria sedimenti]